MAIAPIRRRGGSVLRSEGGQQLRSLDSRKRTGTTARARRRTIRPLQAVPNSGSKCQRGAGSESNAPRVGRSEEHTSELQSQSNLVCRLLLEKKKKNI